MDHVIGCIATINQALAKFDMAQGDVTHALAQIEHGFEQTAQQLLVDFEHSVTTSIGTMEVSRNIDVLAKDLLTRIHTEIKTGARLSDALNLGQLAQDAGLAIENAIRREAGESAETLQNVWKFTVAEFGESVPKTLENHLKRVVEQLKTHGLEEHIRDAIGSFQFIDAAGRVIRSEISENGELIFRNAMGEIFKKDGLIAKEATRQATNSPDFRPAMLALFGPSGEMADAARTAAQRADLQPAMRDLEQKIEQGVGRAMDQAGDAVSAHGARQLGSRVREGAMALSGMLTAIPSFHKSINELGDAWNKPLDSTEAYMNLFSQLGGTIAEGVQLFEALAGVTKIASAAQAVLNAVMAMNPIVLIVMAVIALIGVVVALIYYWDQVKAALRDNPWIAVAAAMTGIIGLIVVVIAYWDEIKLAVLQAANFVSIQVQRIGAFFVGLGNLITQVWDFVTAKVSNFVIGIINGFIRMGVGLVNFFIDFANKIIGMYNKIAKYVPGLSRIEAIAQINVEEKLIPLRETPEVSIEAAFARAGEIRGGLEGAIAERQAVVAEAQAEDERRRAEQARAQPPQPTGVPATAPVPPGRSAPPAVPELPPARAAEAVDRSVNVDGGITVNINAERLELDAAEVLSDEIVRRLKERLDALRVEQDFRLGIRTAAS